MQMRYNICNYCLSYFALFEYPVNICWKQFLWCFCLLCRWLW